MIEEPPGGTSRDPAIPDDVASGLSGPDRRADQAAAFRRTRSAPERTNNSVRRTVDLLISSIVADGQDVTRAENELADAVSASRTTVRTALRLLAGEGWLTRRQNSGTHPRPMLVMPLERLFSVSEFPAVKPAYPEMQPVPIEGRLLDAQELRAPQLVRDRLQLPPGAIVLRTEGLLLQAGERIGVVTSYIALADGERGRITVSDPDVVSVLERQMAVEIGRTDTAIGAVTADPQTAELLGVSPGSALSWFGDVVCDAGGRPRALSHTRMRGDRVAFTVTTLRS